MRSFIVSGRLAPVLAALFFHGREVLVEHDAVFARERDEALPPCAADQRQAALRASSTPQAVKPERDTRMGMPMRTALITISEVRRPVV